MAKLGKYEKAKILPADAVAIMDRAVRKRCLLERRKAIDEADRWIRRTYPRFFRDTTDEADEADFDRCE